MPGRAAWRRGSASGVAVERPAHACGGRWPLLSEYQTPRLPRMTHERAHRSYAPLDVHGARCPATRPRFVRPAVAQLLLEAGYAMHNMRGCGNLGS
jgi:hypothetical protein